MNHEKASVQHNLVPVTVACQLKTVKLLLKIIFSSWTWAALHRHSSLVRPGEIGSHARQISTWHSSGKIRDRYQSCSVRDRPEEDVWFFAWSRTCFRFENATILKPLSIFQLMSLSNFSDLITSTLFKCTTASLLQISISFSTRLCLRLKKSKKLEKQSSLE